MDESGNTGLELYDRNQPTLYYGVLTASVSRDVVALPFLRKLRKQLGVERLHANELGVGRLSQIAENLAQYSKKKDLHFSLFLVSKPDHALICFFDQVFDSCLNAAVPWTHYFTPLRYVLLFKVSYLFDEDLSKKTWQEERRILLAVQKCWLIFVQFC